MYLSKPLGVRRNDRSSTSMLHSNVPRMLIRCSLCDSPTPLLSPSGSPHSPSLSRRTRESVQTSLPPRSRSPLQILGSSCSCGRQSSRGTGSCCGPWAFSVDTDQRTRYVRRPSQCPFAFVYLPSAHVRQCYVVSVVRVTSVTGAEFSAMLVVMDGARYRGFLVFQG
jgi:hypothetical protein